MTAGSRRAGQAISAAAGELARIWRSARFSTRSDVFPGLLDGVVEDLFSRAGEALARGDDPAGLWGSLVGPLRIDPHAPFTSLDALDQELGLAGDVLAATSAALEAGEAADEWLARATLALRSGARAVLERSPPTGVVVVWLLSGLSPARPAGGAASGGGGRASRPR